MAQTDTLTHRLTDVSLFISMISRMNMCTALGATMQHYTRLPQLSQGHVSNDPLQPVGSETLAVGSYLMTAAATRKHKQENACKISKCSYH